MGHHFAERSENGYSYRYGSAALWSIHGQFFPAKRVVLELGGALRGSRDEVLGADEPLREVRVDIAAVPLTRVPNGAHS